MMNGDGVYPLFPMGASLHSWLLALWVEVALTMRPWYDTLSLSLPSMDGHSLLFMSFFHESFDELFQYDGGAHTNHLVILK